MLSLALPRRTWAHDLPAGAKLAGLLVATLVIFPVGSVWVLAALALGAALLVVSLGRDALRQMRRSLRPVLFLAVVVLAFHLWQDRLETGLVVVLRILVLVTLATCVTMTTRLDDLVAIVEKLAAPLRHLGLPPRALALAIAMVIRFVPLILDRYDRLAEAWRARSPRRPRPRILSALLLSILDDADHVGDALVARGGINVQKTPDPDSARSPPHGT